MMGLKALFAVKGVDEAYFLEQKDVFRYDLWFEGAEYSIYIEAFRKGLLDISLLHYLKDVRVDRHVYLKFDKFVEIFDDIEFQVFLDRKISFDKKPREVWSRLQKEAEKIKKGE